MRKEDDDTPAGGTADPPVSVPTAEEIRVGSSAVDADGATVVSVLMFAEGSVVEVRARFFPSEVADAVAARFSIAIVCRT